MTRAPAPPRLVARLLGLLLLAAPTLVAPPSLGAPPAGLPAPLPLADTSPVEGCWQMTLTLPRGMKIEGDLDLKVDGTHLTGSLVGPGGRRLKIEDGEVDGAKLSFALRGPGKKIQLRGEVADDRIEGQASGPGQGKLPWSAQRCARAKDDKKPGLRCPLATTRAPHYDHAAHDRPASS